jgi:hypothetical protein
VVPYSLVQDFAIKIRKMCFKIRPIFRPFLFSDYGTTKTVFHLQIFAGNLKKLTFVDFGTPKRILTRSVSKSFRFDLDLAVAMSNQRSFKFGSFRFAAFVPKKIECKRF